MYNSIINDWEGISMKQSHDERNIITWIYLKNYFLKILFLQQN